MQTEAYRGYLLKQGLLGEWFLWKDGVCIYCAKTLPLAKAAVDELV
jgi:hypothetical protein